MKAPPVPEVFGNYALKGFHQIVLPQDISWLPQTLGWKCVAVALAGLVAYYLSRKIRRRYQNRYRREGVARLNAIAQSGNKNEVIGQLNQVLKLVAMAAYPRTAVANLSGPAWTRFLNAQCSLSVFSKEQENLLASGSYQQISLDQASTQDLVQACLLWTTSHRGTQDD